MIGVTLRVAPLTTLSRTGGTVVPFSAIGNTLVKETQDDARIAPRRRVLKAGVAASNDRHITVACTVRDVSATGARLRTDSSLSIPDTFELIIEVDGLEANCEVIWRKGSEVGARFLGAPRIVAAKRTQVINPLTPPKAPHASTFSAGDFGQFEVNEQRLAARSIIARLESRRALSRLASVRAQLATEVSRAAHARAHSLQSTHFVQAALKVVHTTRTGRDG